MARRRDPAHITDDLSHNFGLNVSVERSPRPKMNELPNGYVGEVGAKRNAFFEGYREVIPPGEIGSEESSDPMLPPAQTVETVPFRPGEQNDPTMHESHKVILDDEPTKPLGFRPYGATWEPRTAPMPRAAQDDLYLEGYGRNAADPRMQDRDSRELFPGRREETDNCDLYGENVAGVQHNKNWIAGAIKHPGSYGHHSLEQIHRDEAKGGKIAKKAHLAETLRNLHK